MTQFSLKHNSMNVAVDFGSGTLMGYMVRLIVDDEVVDERRIYSGTTRLRGGEPQPVVVDATAGLLGPKGASLREGAWSIALSKDD